VHIWVTLWMAGNTVSHCENGAQSSHCTLAASTRMDLGIHVCASTSAMKWQKTFITEVAICTYNVSEGYEAFDFRASHASSMMCRVLYASQTCEDREAEKSQWRSAEHCAKHKLFCNCQRVSCTLWKTDTFMYERQFRVIMLCPCRLFVVCEVMHLLLASAQRCKCAGSKEELQRYGSFHVVAFHKEATVKDTYAYRNIQTGT
jgi:hypothetical protein